MDIIVEKLKAALKEIKESTDLLKETKGFRNERHIIGLEMLSVTLATVIGVMEIEQTFKDKLIRGVQNARFN